MTFIQIVSFRCTDPSALRGIEDEWLAATEGRRTLQRETFLVDRNDPSHFMTINEFESYEAAMQNSELPETDAMARKVARVAGRRADVPRPRRSEGHRLPLVTGGRRHSGDTRRTQNDENDG